VDAGGNLSNTVTADSNESGSHSSTWNIPVVQSVPIQSQIHVVWSSPTTSVTTAGQVVPYTFTVTNTGNVILTGITVTDPKCDEAPAYQSGDTNMDNRLNLSETWIYTCSHTVTQAEVNAGGNLSSTATADSNESGPDTDMLDIPINPTSLMMILKEVGANASGSWNDTSITVKVGSNVYYRITVTNTGNNTLSGIQVSDPALALTGCTWTDPLGVGMSTSCVVGPLTALAGTHNNTASAHSTQTPTDVTDGATYIGSDAFIGIAKRMVGTPVLVGPGTWDVTFEILVKNYSDVALSGLQVTDNLRTTFPAPTTFLVWSVSSAEFSKNWSFPVQPPDYNGDGNNNLLTGVDTLAIGGQGTITVVVRVVPASAGPFNNIAVASGQPPSGPRVTDDSSDGTDPDNTSNCLPTDICVNNDGNPNSNTKPTSIPFVPPLFDPPFGEKFVNASGLPELAWTMVWINGANLVAVNAAVSDPIPVGTTYVAGSLSCTGASPLTTTMSCTYEDPSLAYPRGRVVWTGTVGPESGATDAASANNELIITYREKVNSGVTSVENKATIDSDLNGNGNTTDPGEQNVANAGASWAKLPTILPVTGFSPNRETLLPLQTIPYADLEDLWLEIPRLGVQIPIVGVPQTNGDWDLSWLGDKAGYLNGTAFPTWAGNSVITGHVSVAIGQPGPFVHLNWLWYGDRIIIHTWEADYVYEVRQVTQVAANAISSVFMEEELPWVTLVTCRGYDEASNSFKYRVVVRAVLVEVK